MHTNPEAPISQPRYHAFIFLSCLLLWASSLSGQVLKWAGAMGTTEYSNGRALYTDVQNNLYVTGDFFGTMDMDPGPGEYFLTSNGQTDVFVSKFNDRGNLIWSKSFGGRSFGDGTDIIVDAQGNVYTVGHMAITSIDTIDFDPGPGVYNLITLGNSDIFISKLDRNGNFIWARMFGSTGLDYGNGIDMDDAGNIYTTGFFGGTTDFDPGPGSHILSNPGHSDVFVQKLDPDGQFVWAKGFGGSYIDQGRDIKVHDQFVYTTGFFYETVDFDPGPGTSFITAHDDDSKDAFIHTLDIDGNFIRAGHIGGTEVDDGYSLAVDNFGNLYAAGEFEGMIDIDPGPEQINMTDAGAGDSYIAKFDPSGNYLWSFRIGNSREEWINDMELDDEGNIYIAGYFTGMTDFNPGPGTYILPSYGGKDLFILRLSSDGIFNRAFSLGSIESENVNDLVLDTADNIYITGYFQKIMDFDPSPDESLFLTPLATSDMFLASYTQYGVTGKVFRDFDENCNQAANEEELKDRRILIQPGDIVAQTNIAGSWHVDVIPEGNYTITYDTSGHWKATCPDTVHFQVADEGQATTIPPFGLVSTKTCNAPEISVHINRVRRCFSSHLTISVCNLYYATSLLPQGFVILSLDTLLALTDASIPFTVVGENQYQFETEAIGPGECFVFTANGIVNCYADLGQSICIRADLFPVESCVFEPAETLIMPDHPCKLEDDVSQLTVSGWCQNDSLYFNIVNESSVGQGDMYCYAPVSVFLDGILMLQDSVRLQGGESKTLIYSGDGRTWRLEVEQHPNHIGQSKPSVTVERCGTEENWRAGMITVLSQDDADPVIDIYCDVITGSIDPNDKTGYPTGVGDVHSILPNEKLDYVIRFQNTGNDTAFTVVIRDTLDTDLDILSVRPGVSSHSYDFRMYGRGILEWTFHNILLPDSTTSEEDSHGFVTFSVDQIKNLADGTAIINSVAIYFDFNAPVITNSTLHTVNRNILIPSWTQTNEKDIQSCQPVILNGLVYTQSGKYFQIADGEAAPDTLVTLNIEIPTQEGWTDVVLQESTLISKATEGSYQWIDCNTNKPIAGATESAFTPGVSGSYAVVVSQNGCVDTSSCLTVNIVGIDKPLPLHYLVYPNPTDGAVTIDFQYEVSDIVIELTDIAGRVVDKYFFTGGEYFTINIDRGPGLYFMRVAEGGSTSIIKIIRK